MKASTPPSEFETSAHLARRLGKIRSAVMDSELLDLARDLADHPGTPVYAFEHLEPIIESGLPDCLWTAAEWDAMKVNAAARWKQDAPKGNPRRLDQREADRQALMRLCAEYNIARKTGGRALKRWVVQRSLMEIATLAVIEAAEAPVGKILINLVIQKEIQKREPEEVLADE